MSSSTHKKWLHRPSSARPATVVAHRPHVTKPAVAYSRAWYETLAEQLGEVACRRLGIYAIPDSLLLSVVVPVFNERDSLEGALARVRAVPIRKEIILVDDGSTDGTQDILRKLQHENTDDTCNQLVIKYHDRNYGKGRALRTGFQEARGDIVLVQDADLEYNPAEYPRLLQPIIEGEADVVYGSRFLSDDTHRVVHFWHSLRNKVLTMLANCLNDLDLTDAHTCYKVFTRDVVREIAPTLKRNRFGFCPEITAKIARRKRRVFEVPISYRGRTYAEGKKIGWRDGLDALWCIVRYRIAD